MAAGDNEAGKTSYPFGVLTRQAVCFTYRNYRGEVSTRTVVPLHIMWGANEWHPEEQWLLYAIDVKKEAQRLFAMKDITGWKPV